MRAKPLFSWEQSPKLDRVLRIAKAFPFSERPHTSIIVSLQMCFVEDHTGQNLCTL